MHARLLLALAVSPLWISDLARAAQAPRFEDISAEALPGVTTLCDTTAKDWIVGVNGGGLGLEDLDGDGHLDLIVVDGSSLARVAAGKPGMPPRVFLGEGDGGFRPGGEAWRMDGGRWGTGLALGDVDGDGWCDLLICQWGELRLFRNLAGKGLAECKDTGLQGEGWHTSAAFHDLDGDGHLDLVVTRYLDFDLERVPARGENGAVWKGQPVMAGPEGLSPQTDRVLLGRGDGTFEELPGALAGADPGFGLGVVVCDLDGDSRPDIYVSNDSTANHLWRSSEGDVLRLEEVAFARGASHDSDGREQAGMGIAVGREAAGRAPSVFVTNFSGESNALYRPSRRGSGYRERSARSGLAGPGRPLLGWGTGFLDVELDGDLDLWVLNGHVYPEADAAGTDTRYAQPDQLFVADGDRFAAEALDAGRPRVSRAGVQGDLDGDGDEDLVVLTLDGPVRVLRNTAERAGDWIAVDLRAAGPNTAAIGALLRVSCGERSWEAEVHRCGGFQASRPARRVFGLGRAKGDVQVEVQWPSGRNQVLRDLERNQIHRLVEPQ